MPFDVEVLKYYPNSKLREVREGDDNPATAGAGKRLVPTPLPTGSGTDIDQKVDLASAYVKLLAKESGAPIGTYLVSGNLPPQSVVVDGKPYSISLRFKRDYKPYIVELVDVRKDDYLGTNTPRNYSSDVRIIDPAHHVDRQVHIWMNNPLRYAGDTLYQSGYHPGPPETTTLQVVKNTGWMIPYVGCMIVATGMLAHFSLTLVRFLRRRDAEELADEHADAQRSRCAGRQTAPQGYRPAPARPRSRWTGVAIPAAVVVVLAGWLAVTPSCRPRSKGNFTFTSSASCRWSMKGAPSLSTRWPAMRCMILSGRQSFKDEAGKNAAGNPLAVGRDHPQARPCSSIGFCTSTIPRCLPRSI